jgi:HK97 family phage major capsid protein
MSDQILDKIAELKTELGKNVEAVAKVESLERDLATKTTSLKKAEETLARIESENKTRDEQIVALKRESRVVGVMRDGVQSARDGLAILGMQFRQALARHAKSEVPAEFKEEETLIRDFLARATLQAGGVTGSYLVPTVTNAELIDAIEELSDVLSRVDMVTGLPGASSMLWPVQTGRSTLQPARATVDTAASESAPTFGQLELTPKEAYVYFPVTNRLLQMSAIDLGRVCQQNLRDSVIAGLADWVINADGTAAYNSFTGILCEATGAYIYIMPAGKTSFNDLKKSYVTAAKQQLLKRGRARGVFLSSLSVLGVLEEEDRLGKAPTITYDNGGNARVLMMPSVLDENMPTTEDTGVSKGFAAIGDLATIMVALVGQMEFAVSEHVLFNKMQTAFRGVINAAIARKPVATLITMKTPAQ